MIVENKHTSLYWNGQLIPVGVSNLDDKAAEHFIKRGLLKEVKEQTLEVATPKKTRKPKKAEEKPEASE
jgi:hypothetical protein